MRGAGDARDLVHDGDAGREVAGPRLDEKPGTRYVMRDVMTGLSTEVNTGDHPAPLAVWCKVLSCGLWTP